MSVLITIYNEVFHRPLLNILIFLTGVLPFHDLGFAVIILTVLVRAALFPFTHHSVKAQAKMRELEPDIANIRSEFKDKQEEQARRIMALYKEHGVNPFSGCLMLLIQLPLLIALYRVFLVGLTNGFTEDLYSFISVSEQLNTMFLGLINLADPNVILAIIAAATQFIQMKLAIPSTPASKSSGNDMSRMMTKQMIYVMPGIILVIGLQFPSAVALYWTTMNVFAIIHEAYVRRKARRITINGSEHGN